MTFDKDDLEQALQENLRLRRELGAEAFEGEATIRANGGMAYRLGWVLYWTCLTLAAGWLVFWISAVNRPFGFLAEDTLQALASLVVPALALYGLGRAFRYVLSAQ